MGFEEIIEVEPTAHHDERGFFLVSYEFPKYSSLGIDLIFPQDNHSFSKKGVIRGMHFQKGQAKFIYCPKGEILDVVVDIRRGSSTFGKWRGYILNEKNHKQLFIPDGFAHGFCVLSDEAHVMYKVSTLYDKTLESGFLYNDPKVGIDWPIKNPIVSARDKNARSFEEAV
jgi:dTDP-4-dehydrorhamnose 3,5-epimerase